jgi:hypothetical protein
MQCLPKSPRVEWVHSAVTHVDAVSRHCTVRLARWQRVLVQVVAAGRATSCGCATARRVASWRDATADGDPILAADGDSPGDTVGAERAATGRELRRGLSAAPERAEDATSERTTGTTAQEATSDAAED